MTVPSAVRVSAAALLLVALAPLAATGAPDILVFPGGCRTIDAMDADAWGEAVALIVRVDGEDILESPYSPVTAFQDGPGMNSSERAWREVEVPGLLTAKILYSRVDLRVDRDPMRSQAWAQAEVVDLNVLNGTITADVVKGWAAAKTEVNLANTTTVDSDIVGLKVGSLADVDIAPGVTVMLPEATKSVVGPASFVKTYVREDESRFPGNGTINYVADTTVTMLHVWLANVAGLGSVEIIVSRAHAHAETPTPFCGLVQSVKGAAYITRIRPTIDATSNVLIGEQFIGVVGGEARQQLVGAQAPVGPKSLMEMNVTESEVRGWVKASGESRSSAMSKVLGLCILEDGTVAPEQANTDDYGRCFIGATAIRAESNSKANATAAISWGTVTIVGLTVAGIDVCKALGYPNDDHIEGNGSATTNVCKPPKNSTLEIAGIKLFFNQREYDEPRPGHTGYYVRALRVQGPVIGDVIISRAYSGADYLEEGPGNPIGPLSGEKP